MTTLTPLKEKALATQLLGDEEEKESWRGYEGETHTHTSNATH